MACTRGLAALAAFVVPLVAFVGRASADRPRPWQTGFQEAATPVMERIDAFHDLLLVIIFLIGGFVVLLLLYVMLRFRAGRNPTPSKTSHNTVLEVVWTTVPIMVLVFIAIPSFKLIYFADRVAKADMTIKATGRQYSWTYEYPDHGGLEFDSNIACRELPDPAAGTDECAEATKDLWYTDGRKAIRLLDVDNPLVVPVGVTIRLLVAADPDGVIHSWAVPAFGIKLDAVPGRVNETWMRVDREGVYYGQCSELCGEGHGYMPIAVKAVSKAAFERWLVRATEEFAATGGPKTARVAAAELRDQR